MRIYDIIDKKRRGLELTRDEISFFVSGFVNGDIADYQASALLMAVCCNGMTDAETAHLTSVMASSGQTLDLSRFGNLSVDKHSTGGVGDKTTLIIAPIVASLGCKVAKLSGRGLGHTGGTIDKLESVSGFRTDLSSSQFMSVVENCGICVCGAGVDIAPADKKLYALRDVTATVNSIPLIVSSIMSKKLAGGAKSIVLDVKTGSGAFMKDLDSARELASRMVAIGKLSGRNVSAVITNMDRPLGKAVGNLSEVFEAASLLRNPNDTSLADLKNVCCTLSAELVSLSQNIPFDESLSVVDNALQSGKAYSLFLRWLSLQGGNVSLLENGFSARYESEVVSPCDGYIASTDATGQGIAAMMLGAGRATKTDVIDPYAGITLLANVGDKVHKGQPLARLYSNTVSNHTAASERWINSLNFSQSQPAQQPLVYEIIR